MLNKIRVNILLQKILIKYIKYYKKILLQGTKIFQIHAEKK